MGIKKSAALQLSTAVAVALLSGCGSDSEPSVKHLTAVADPDPQTPFFNEDTANSFTSLGDTTSSWISDLSKVFPTETTTAKSPTAPTKARSIMAADPQLDCQSGNIRARGFDNPDNFRATLTFNNCNNDGVLTNGSLTVNGSIQEELLDSDYGSANVAVTFNDLRMSGQESASINGDISIEFLENAEQLIFNIAGTALTTVSEGQTNTIRDYQLAMSEDQGQTTMTLDMTLHSTEHGSITFETNTPLTDNIAGDHPSSGMFTMTHSDGSYLIVDADNGNPDTFGYTIFNGSSTISGDKPWSEFDMLDSL